MLYIYYNILYIYYDFHDYHDDDDDDDDDEEDDEISYFVLRCTFTTFGLTSAQLSSCAVLPPARSIRKHGIPTGVCWGQCGETCEWWGIGKKLHGASQPCLSDFYFFWGEMVLKSGRCNICPLGWLGIAMIVIWMTVGIHGQKILWAINKLKLYSLRLGCIIDIICGISHAPSLFCIFLLDFVLFIWSICFGRPTNALKVSKEFSVLIMFITFILGFSHGLPMGFPMLPMAKPWEDWMQLVPNLLSSEGWSMALARPKANLSHCDPAKGDAQRGWYYVPSGNLT